MESIWVSILSTANSFEAELAKNKLEANEIPAVIKSEQDSSYTVLGLIKLFVRRDDVIKAKYILKENNS